MPRLRPLLSLILLLGTSAARGDDPAPSDPVQKALAKATVRLEDHGQLSDLFASIRETTGINVVCAPGIKLDALQYSFRGPSKLRAGVALQATLGSNGLSYDSFASCIYISSARNPTRRPPDVNCQRASKQAQARLAEVVPVTIEREDLEEAFQTLGDLIGLKVRAPNSEEQTRGYKAPDMMAELTLDVDGLPGIDILRLVSRHLQVGLTVVGDEVVVSSLTISIRSDNTAAVAKRLGERPDFTLPAGTLAELGAFLEKKLQVRVFVNQDIADAPVTSPPADLSLGSMLLLAPGIRSGIDHRLLGEALVFERRLGRARPVDYITSSEAAPDLLIALRSQKLTVDFQAMALSEALAFIDKLAPKAELGCAKEVADRRVSFRAADLSLQAILLHVARLTDTRIVFKGTTVRFDAPQ